MQYILMLTVEGFYFVAIKQMEWYNIKYKGENYD